MSSDGKVGVVAVLLAAAMTVGCGPNQRIIESAASPTPAPVSAPAPTTLEQEIGAMRNADFNFIYVFRRPDRAELTADDKKYVADRVPLEINRRKLADGGRAIILGSNFRLAPETRAMLLEKFTLDDLSKPESEIMNANSNAGK